MVMCQTIERAQTIKGAGISGIGISCSTSVKGTKVAKAAVGKGTVIVNLVLESTI